jgi:protein phosphatase PTC6
VDLVRDAIDPKTAAERILAFSEELGGNDNATAIVIPLAGWNKIGGPDKTRELRDYRRLQAGMISKIHVYTSHSNGRNLVGSERQRRM